VADFEVTLRVNLDAGNLSGQLAGELGRVKSQYSGFDSEINKVQKSLTGAAAAQARMAQGLSTTRYALYDVSSTLAAMGAGLLAFAAGSTAVAVAWERDFANVVRTSQLVGDEIDSMRQDLIGLAQTMPLAFGDITQIATLAGQLGIAKNEVADFTQVVAQFAAISDVSIDAAATAFGRMDSLLPSVNGNFQALGSSIAKVAVESVATESQIISIATQISGIGNFAGLTADQVVGLSGALASVGTAPELSRGVVTRLFTNMSRAVSEGSDRLDKFGEVAGVSGDEFASAFGTDRMGPMLENFILGLNRIEQNGGNTVATLAELGIVSVRDVPALLRLASATDVVTGAFSNAKTGFEDANELNRQYGIIAETTASKIQVLGNNFQAFLNSIGSASTGPLNEVVGHLSDILRIITDIVSTPAGQSFALIAVGVTALLGVLALLGAATAVGFAGIIAMQQALVGLGVAANGVGLKALVAQLAATGAAGQAAALGIKAAGLAIKGLGLALAAVVAIDIASGITKGLGDMNYELQGLSQDGAAALDRISGSMANATKYFRDDIWTSTGDGVARLNRAFADISWDTGLRDIAAADEYIASIAESGNADQAARKLESLRVEWVAGGGAVAQFKAAFVDSYAAIEAAQQSATDSEVGTGLGEGLQQLEQDAQDAKAALDAVRQAILNIGSTSIGQEQAAINLASALNQMRDAATQADVSLTGTNDSSLAFRNSLIQVDLAARESALALVDNGASAEAAVAGYQAGRQAIIDQITAFTGNAAAAAEWADRILGSSAEAANGIEAYADEVEATPEAKDLTLTNNAEEASGPVRDYDRNIDGILDAKPTEFSNNAIPMGMNVSGYSKLVDKVAPRKNTTLSNNAGAAGGAVSGYIGLLGRIPRYVSTSVVTNYSSTGSPQTIRNPATYKNYATGGAIYGAGTKTSDSVPIWASTGEFMMRAAAVDKYGLSLMNAINSGKFPVQKLAAGGPVGPAQSSGFTTGVFELGPKSLQAVAREIAVNVMLDQESLSRAVESGNKSRRVKGDM
jgi:TP901 family phage tail tape measure protein